MSNKPTLFVEASFYETLEKVSSRYCSSPYALTKIESLFSRRKYSPDIFICSVIIEPRYDFEQARTVEI